MSGTLQGPFSDLYALGATFYRAIGGTTVDSFTRHQALLRGKRDPQPTAAQVGIGRYPEELLATIDAALAVDPHSRPQSIRALLAQLNGNSDTLMMAPPTRGAVVRPEREPAIVSAAAPSKAGKAPRFLLSALAGVSLLVISGGAYWATRPERSGQRITDSRPGDESSQPPAALAPAPPPQPAPDQPPAAQPSPVPAVSTPQIPVAADHELADRAVAARSAAHSLAARAKTTISGLGLDPRSMSGEFDTLMLRADDEFGQADSQAALDDYDRVENQILDAVRNLLESRAAALSKLAETKMNAGDLTKAQAAIDQAKKLKQAEAEFR
jgi:hypothetical protein